MIWSFVGMPDDSLQNFYDWLGVSILCSLMVGTTMGMFFSTVCKNDMDAVISVNFFCGGLYFSSGLFANIRDRNNLFLDFMYRISPFSYFTEVMMRLLLKGLPKDE